MTLKQRVILSIGWLVLILVLSSVAFAIMVNTAPRRERAERATMLGGGAGVVISLGWAGLWLPYAAALGKRRREERERARRKRKRRD